MLSCRRSIAVFFCLAAFCVRGHAAVETYDFPKEVSRAADFTVTADGQPVFVYDTKVAAIATFGVAGKVEIHVKPSAKFRTVVIRPLSKHINGR